MTVVANLIFTQGVAGSAGRYFVGVSGASVTLSNEVDTDVTNWKYELLDVPSSSSLSIGTLSDGGSPTAAFTPDASGGGYRIKLTVTGPSNTSEFIGTFFVPTGWFSWLLPAYLNEAAEVVAPGSAPPPTGQGWMKLLNNVFLTVDTTLGPFYGLSPAQYQHLEFDGTSWTAVDNLTLPVPSLDGGHEYRFVFFGPNGNDFVAPAIGSVDGNMGYRDENGSWVSFSDMISGGLPSGSAYQHLEWDDGLGAWTNVDDIALPQPAGEATTRYIYVDGGSAGNGGHLRIESGTGHSGDTGTRSGNITLSCPTAGMGSAGSSGNGGSISLYAGDGADNEGDYTAGAGGNVNVWAGDGGSNSSTGDGGYSGNVDIKAGSGGGSTSGGATPAGGDITLTPGSTASAAATDAGKIIITEPTAAGSGAGLVIEVDTGAATPPALQVTDAGTWQYRNEGGAFSDIGSGSGGAGFGTFSSRPAAGTAGALYYCSDSPITQWIDDGASWRPVVGDTLCTQPPVASSFTARNKHASGTITDYQGTLELFTPGESSAAARGYEISTSGNTMYCEACFDFDHAPPTSTSTCWYITGVWFVESGTGKILTLGLSRTLQSGVYEYQIVYEVWSSSSTRSSISYNEAQWGIGTGPIFIRLRRSTGTIYLEYTRNRGVYHNAFVAINTTTAFTTAPDLVGLYNACYSVSGNAGHISVIKHFKYGTL